MKIILTGYQGKMGQMALATLQQANYTVYGVGATDDLVAAIKVYQPDIIVDLTTPHVVAKHIHIGLDHGIPMVVGTTGLSIAEQERFTAIAQEKRIGVLLAPNFSIGALLMMHCAQLAQHFYDDIQITEVHHPQKKDQPSGTALRTQALIDKPVMIHSRRQEGVLADQTVDFANSGEIFSLVHHTVDRSCFMPGLLFAVKQVKDLKRLVYGLEQVLFPKGMGKPAVCF